MKKWTKEEEIKLLQLKAEGFTVNEIGVRMHRTKGSIKSKLEEFNFAKQKNWTIDEERILVSLLRQGASNLYAALILGRTLKAVQSKLAKENLFEKYPTEAEKAKREHTPFTRIRFL